MIENVLHSNKMPFSLKYYEENKQNICYEYKYITDKFTSFGYDEMDENKIILPKKLS